MLNHSDLLKGMEQMQSQWHAKTGAYFIFMTSCNLKQVVHQFSVSLNVVCVRYIYIYKSRIQAQVYSHLANTPLYQCGDQMFHHHEDQCPEENASTETSLTECKYEG